jgi:RNA polymerase sigma-70 factor (ECF subfamily)
MKQNDIENIYKTLVSDVYRYSFFKLKNKEQAEEVTSETFTRFIEKGNIPTSNTHELKIWIIGIARNVIYERYRELKRNDHIDLDSENEDQIEEDINIEQVILDEDLKQNIKENLESLDDLTKDVIVLKIWEGLKFSEISEINNLNINTTKALYYRGIGKLKSNLEQTSNIRINTVAIPMVVAGIAQIVKASEFSVNASVLTKIISILKTSNLILSSNIMSTAVSSTGIAGTIASSGAIAGTTAKASFLTTTIGKVVVGGIATLTLVGGGIGTAVLIDKSNDDNDENVVSYPSSYNAIEDQEPVVAWTDCKSDNLGISLRHPKDWSCTLTGTPEQQYINLEKGSIKYSIGIGARGACIDCNVTEFYKTDVLDLREYRKSGLYEIVGSRKTGEGQSLQIIVRLSQEDLTKKESDAIKEISDSVKLINAPVEPISWNECKSNNLGASIEYPTGWTCSLEGPAPQEYIILKKEDTRISLGIPAIGDCIDCESSRFYKTETIDLIEHKKSDYHEISGLWKPVGWTVDQHEAVALRFSAKLPQGDLSKEESDILKHMADSIKNLNKIADYSTVRSEKCKVEFKMPPKVLPYKTSSDDPSQTMFWQFKEAKITTKLVDGVEAYDFATVFYATDVNLPPTYPDQTDINFSFVSVSCMPFTHRWDSLDQAFAEVKKNKPNFVDKGNISKWGFTVKSVVDSRLSASSYYLFYNDQYLYLVEERKTSKTSTIVQLTVATILDNLKFD